MPTLGWIQEDAWERYLASLPQAEPLPPGPPRVRCPFCAADFADMTGMLSHLSDSHRGERPVLLLRAIEPPASSQTRVGTALRASEVVLQNCTAATLALDGLAPEPIPVADIPGALARQRDALVDLQLVHHFDKEARPIATGYRLRIQVPDKRALDAVDRAFQRHLAVDAPDFGAVDSFLSNRACTGAARAYAEALASYVRGVLVKDRPMAAAVTLPFARYRDLYVAALDGLEPYRRPLADIVCATVRFALNNFGSPVTTGFGPLDGASRSLAALAGGASAISGIAAAASGATVGVCPLDDGVSRVLDLWRRLRERPAWSPVLEDECRQVASSGALDAPDREKALALWAEAALRSSPEAAAEPLGLLSATYPFGTWASAERERTTNGR